MIKWQYAIDKKINTTPIVTHDINMWYNPEIKKKMLKVSQKAREIMSFLTKSKCSYFLSSFVTIKIYTLQFLGHLKFNVQRIITTIFKLHDIGHFLRFGQLEKLIYTAGMDR